MNVDEKRIADYWRLRRNVGWLDLSARSRLLIKGADRKRFLHGQVSNDVNKLQAGQGCYAAIVTAKGKIESDVFIWCLEDALLLDFEPGLTQKIAARFDKYVIADDVQIEDASGLYNMYTVQGREVSPPPHVGGYVFGNARGTAKGFDVFVPFGQKVDLPGTQVSEEALEIVRIEAGQPRFGVDMDESNLAPEAGIEARAISYAKGCYIGQEVISRVRTYGQVARALRGLRCESLLKRGDKLFLQGKEVGYVTSAVFSPALQQNIALGYVRREHNAIGTRLDGAEIVQLPFVNPEGTF
ncbi:MAG TPA: glycine cleavage T C-terminal barrel domain-containing protein [Verrucomicrobiae bacterium]|nr:glycine cleavage T C-terminal barrel domain-containing protein [Verrucomicrobiae bacterium]